MQTHLPSQTKGLYVSEYVDLERFDDFFAQGQLVALKTDKRG